MTGALVGVTILLGFVALVTVWYAVARVRSAGREPGRPDQISDEVVSGLLTELRKWQAESAYWKSAAERLQRELDQRQ